MIFVDLGKLHCFGLIFSAFHHMIGAADLASSQQPIRLQKAVTCVASPPSPARKSLGIAFVLRQAVHHDLGAARSALDTAPSATAERFGGFRQSGVREPHLKSPGNSEEIDGGNCSCCNCNCSFFKNKRCWGLCNPPPPPGNKRSSDTPAGSQGTRICRGTRGGLAFSSNLPVFSLLQIPKIYSIFVPIVNRCF